MTTTRGAVFGATHRPLTASFLAMRKATKWSRTLEAIGTDYTFALDVAELSSKTLLRSSPRNLSLPNMDNKPQALTRTEIEEIAGMEDIRQMWGAESAAEMEGMLETSVYAVKFTYQSGGPGYVGDLYILLGDTPDEPLRLIRVKGALEILD